MLAGLWRAVLLGLLLVGIGCAGAATAGTRDGGSGERCECNMSGVNRAIPFGLIGEVNPNASVIHPGDVFYPLAGGAGLLFVYRDSPTTNAVINLLANVQFTAVFTPSSSGDGVIAIVVTDVLTGAPVSDALIDVDLLSGGAIASVGISGGLGVMNAQVGAGTVSMIVHAQTDAAGLLSLAFNGTASATYRFTITSRDGSPILGGLFVQQLTGTLPA